MADRVFSGESSSALQKSRSRDCSSGSKIASPSDDAAWHGCCHASLGLKSTVSGLLPALSRIADVDVAKPWKCHLCYVSKSKMVFLEKIGLNFAGDDRAAKCNLAHLDKDEDVPKNKTKTQRKEL